MSRRNASGHYRPGYQEYREKYVSQDMSFRDLDLRLRDGLGESRAMVIRAVFAPVLIDSQDEENVRF